MPSLRIPTELAARADAGLLATLDSTPDADLVGPSLLPGWSRAHVLAHLVLNAEALERVLTGLRTGVRRTMYDDNAARDRDIDALSRQAPTTIRERLVRAVGAYEQARDAMTDEDAAQSFERTPGGQVIRVRNIPLMRLREVEVHHADLDLAYAHTDWPQEFSAVLIESMAHHVDAEPFRVRADDLARTWQLGTGRDEGAPRGPLVSGAASSLGWWLTGRGDGHDLATDADTLPRIDPW